MAQLIDKDALVAEIKNRRDSFYSLSESCEKGTPAKAGFYAQAQTLEGILSFIDTLEVKEVDMDALGILAEHLLACEAHAVSPKYRDEELDLLEKMSTNKTQKGE